MTETQTALCLDPGTPGAGLQTTVAKAHFSYFDRPVTSTVPSGLMSVWEAYLNIRSERNQHQTTLLRSITDRAIARNYKARNFDSCCFSGVFSTRSEAGLICHSGLLTIDFDHIADIQELKAALLCDPYFETVLAFKSPSGDGLKWIVEIDIEEHTHLQWFNAIAAYIKATCHLEIDASGKDISRCCFLPWDPDVYISPKYIQ